MSEKKVKPAQHIGLKEDDPQIDQYFTLPLSEQEKNMIQESQKKKGNQWNINTNLKCPQKFETNKESIELILPNQNQCPAFPSWNNPSLESIKQINNQMNIIEPKPTNFSYLWNLWNRQNLKQFIQSFEFIVLPENWHLYRYQFQKPLEMFLQLYSTKIQPQPYHNHIYPGLAALIKKIQNGIEVKRDRSNGRFQDNPIDKLYRHFLDQIKSRVRREGAFFIKDQKKPDVKIPIGQFIAKEETVSKSYPWNDIYFKSSIYRKQQQQSEQAQVQLKRQRQNKALVIKQIIQNGKTIYPPDNYLCCAQYFFFNQKIYDQIITVFPVLTERDLKPLESISDSQLKETMLDICGLLNSGGGVILFNASKVYLQIWPKGQNLLQSHCSEIKKKIQSEIKNIKPLIQMGRQIFVNFVPINRNPITNPNYNQVLNRSYIQGLYVMRIIVRPSEDQSEYIYFYSKSEEHFQTAVVSKNTRKNVTKTQIPKLMKKKFNNYYVSQNDYESQQQKNMIKKSYSWFTNHQKCLQPQRGVPLVVNTLNDQQQNNNQLQKKFKYITLIVTHKNNFNTVKQRLRSKGIQCQVLVQYEKYRFKASHNSAALYHNLRFDHLLSEVAYKKQFQFDGRYILTILVTKFIKLQNRDSGNIMPQADFSILEKWLEKEHPKEKLIMWKYQESRDFYQFYIETGSKLSTLFIYYVMNHYSQKCIFKNPKDYEKLSQKEKSQRMSQFYPRIKN